MKLTDKWVSPLNLSIVLYYWRIGTCFGNVALLTTLIDRMSVNTLTTHHLPVIWRKTWDTMGKRKFGERIWNLGELKKNSNYGFFFLCFSIFNRLLLDKTHYLNFLVDKFSTENCLVFLENKVAESVSWVIPVAYRELTGGGAKRRLMERK